LAVKTRNETKWWGEASRGEKRLSLLDLVKNGTLDVETAALLWLVVEKKGSVIVASQAPLAGKTTLLTALMDFLSSKYEEHYIYGGGSDVVPPANSKPLSSYILAPELGPGNVSGKSLVSLFKSLAKGFSLGATVKADSPEEVFRTLSSGRMAVPSGQLARLHAIINLRTVQGPRSTNRRVSQLTLIAPRDGSGWRMVTLAGWEPDDDSHLHMNSPETRATLASRLKMDADDLDGELAERARRLQAWLDIRLTNARQLRQAVLKYYELRDHPPAKPAPAQAAPPRAKAAPPSAKAKASAPAPKAKPAPAKAKATPSKKTQPVKAKPAAVKPKAKTAPSKPKPKAKAPPPKPKLKPKARRPLPKSRSAAASRAKPRTPPARQAARARTRAKTPPPRKAPPARARAKTTPRPKTRPAARPAASRPRPKTLPAPARARPQAKTRPRSRSR
jgi:hypothetical protein